MKNFTFKINLQILLSLVLSTLCINIYAGEGSKQTTPDVNHRASLCINNDEYGNFARYGSTNEQRLYIRIQNPNSEKVYLGFTRARRTAPDNSNEIDSKFRIMKPDGTVAFASYNLTSITANITGTEAQRLSRAQNGPNGIDGVTTAGYVPIVFDPTGMPAGDYWIEFESNSSNYSELYYNYYDITVANNSTKNSIPGRLYSKRWAFAMNNVTTDFTGAFYVFAPDNGSTTGATTQNGFVNKINFNGAGFRPWYFNVAFNNTGPGNSGNAANDQKSVYNASDATKMSPKYEVFLNDPDINVWKNGTYNGNIVINGITNCGIGESNINISVFKSGTIEILLDFNGGDGIYTPGTKDVLTTQTVTASGAPPYAVSVPWNGKDGLGNTIAQGTNIPIVVTFGQAAFHFPIYDVEENQYGFSCTTVRPAAPSGYVLKFYWDDSAITYTGGTFDAKVNLTGCTPNSTPPGNCHRWNGFNSNNNGSPQYGNLNTINTWWYANRDFVTSTIVLPPFYTVALDTKTNVKCFGGNDGTIQIKATNGTAPYTYYINGGTTPNTLQNLTAGTYDIKVVDANGCSASVNGVVITQPLAALALAASSKTDASCFGKSTGSVTAGTVTNAIGTVTYSWKNSANVVVGTTATVSNLPAGTYTVTVTDTCSSQSNSVTIGQPAAALALGASSKTDASCFGASTGSVTAGTVTNAIGTVTYSWKNSANVVVGTTATVSNLPAGTYTVTVTDTCSSQSNSVTIGQPAAALALGISSKTDASCFGKSTGSVTAGTVTNAIGTVNYSWKNSANVVVGTTATVSNLPAGTYTLTVTDTCSSQSNSVTIGQPAAALALGSSSKTDASCFGASSGSVTAGTVTNAIGTVNYSWKNSANVVVGTTATVSNLPAGTYTVTVTDTCSSQSNSVTIGQPAAALALGTSSKTDASCFGKSTGSVTAGTVTNAIGTVTYSWKNSGGIEVGTSATVSNLPAGTYTLTVTDSCSSQSNSVTIGQPAAALALGTSSKTDASCFGKSTGSVTAGTVTNAIGTVNYSWKNSGGIEVGTSATVSDLPSGTYTLTITDSCSSQSNSVTIGQPAAALALGVSSKTDASCFGKSTGSVTAGTVTNAIGTVTYSWKNSGGIEVGTSATVSNLPAGTYTLTVTDSCSSQSNSVTIGQPAAALALGVSSKTDASCFGKSTGSVTAGTVTNAIGTVTYSWKNSGGIEVGTSATVSNLPAGTYTLTVTDSCSSQSNSVTIGQPAAALALSESSKTDASCFGKSTGSVTAGTVTNAIGTVNYSWKNSGGIEVGTSATVSNLPAGTYTLTVTDTCSSQSNSVTIGQPAAALALGASSKTDVFCFGASTGTVTAGTVTNAIGTVNYSWKNSGGIEVGTSATVSDLPSGTYTLTITDSCSSQSNSVTISQPAIALSCSIIQNKAVTSNGLSDGEATVTPIGGNVGYTYLWDNNETTQKAVGLSAGLHSVTVTDSKGCTTTCTVTITQPDVFSCSISQDSAVKCFGENTGKATITAVGGNGDYTYLWDNGETTAQAIALSAGVHNVTVTDKLNYTTTCSVTISQPQQGLSATKSQTDVTCGGGNNGSATVTVSGGTPTYLYSWNSNPVQTGATANNLPAGNYTVLITDANGCQISESFTILDGDSIKPIINPLPETTTINCPAEPVFTQATATDDSGTVSSLTYVDTITEGNCAGSYTKTRTWTAKDACDNVSLPVSQTIIVQDITAPTWTTSAGSLNTTLECSDAEGLAAAQAKFPTASDSCDADVTNITKASGQFVASEGCANAGTYTNTWTVKDDCGNESVAFTQIITIQDTTAPTWTTAAGSLNATLECSDAEGLAAAQAKFPTASDSCDADVANITKASGQFVASEGCANAGTYTNTWTVKDDCGNESVAFTQIITIQDTTAPTWTTAAGSLNATLECSDAEGLAAAQAKFPTASDSCDADVANITKASGQFVASEGCANAGTYTNTWTVKDDCGNESVAFTQIITIQDTTAPTWTTAAGSLNATLECSDAEGLAAAQAKFPTASDSCDADVANITKASGQFVASEGCANAGTYTNTWTVKDDCGNESVAFTQIITIQDTTAPTWTTAAGSLNATLECSDAEGLAAAQAKFPTASDSCDADVANITKASGQFVASEGCANAGTYTNTWTVKDDCGNESVAFTQIITIQDTTAPTWTTAAGSLNATLECSDAEGLAAAQAKFPTASDSCDADVTNITKTSGQFVASEGCANAGTYTNTWTVKDDCGNESVAFTQIITIQDTTAPTWTTAAGSLNATLECSDAEGLAAAQAKFPTASDSCDADVTNITKASGQFVASEGCANAGTYTNTWTVKDDCGNESETFTQIITIQDTTAPTWTTAAGSLNATLECSDAEGLAAAQAKFPTASDSCDADVANITKASGQFVASENCSNAGTYTNTWTVKDDCGNESETFTQIITIQDTTAPLFTGTLPLDIEVSCDAVPEPAEMLTSDNCNGDLPIVYTETKSGIENECPSNYTLTRTWKISDCGGNTTTHVQVITVRDKTAPTGTAPESVTNLASIDVIPVGNPSDIKDAADNCSPTVNITVTDTNNGGNGCDGEPYILTRTYTLTDCAGNKTELVQTFTVERKVTVSGIATNTSCFGGSDGSITVSNSAGSTVVITNERNEVVGNTNLPAGTYTLTATAPINGENQTCSATATVVITQPEYSVKISGQIINIDTNAPIANVPVTLVPQGTTTGPIQMHITGADGMYSFSGMPAGSYLVQVQDANLNSAYQLYPVNSSLFFTTLEDCKIQTHNFEYGASKLPVLGDYVWFDTNSNGIQDEWYDANNDGIVTKNIPDSNGNIDYSQWEWIDLNGDGSYTGPQNVGELNAGGFGNALNANIIIDGPNGYHDEVIVGIEGFWRNRPDIANPYGEYTIKLVRDANFDTMAANLGLTGLVKVLPSISAKNIAGKTGKMQLHTVCKTTTDSGYIVTITPEDLVHLDNDFGISCKEYKDIVANDDSADPIPGVNHTTTNVLNVLPNDTLEGNTITASDVIITTVTPNEFLQLNPDGSVDVLPNAPAGTLTMVYQICEADQTDNCDTATVTVTIEAPVMTVTATSICVNDVPYIDYVVTPVNFTPVNGVTIAWADSNNNVVTTMNNLPLSGRVLWPGAVVDDQGKGIDWPGWVFENNKWIEAADGFEKLRPTANVTLSVNPSETITVNYPPADPYCTARPTFAIVANDDNPAPIISSPTQTTVGNVLTNDTLNGSAVNINDVTLTTTVPDPTGSISVGPDGTINVAANTPGGTYTLTYQICEKADFGNCDTAIVTVIVISPIVANDDTYSNIGCNSFGLVGNIFSNDLKGRTPVTIELVNFTLLTEGNNTKTDPNITVDASGNVNVSSLTPAGTYTYGYTICDKSSPDNCDSATVTIIVIPSGVVEVRGTACNDDSTLINLSTLLPEGTPSTGVWQDRNNTNALQGGILNPFGLALGNYTFEYIIADERCPRNIVLNMEINDDCKVLACGDVLVHNAFSPNGDNINDFFKIDNIDDTTCYPTNSVEIYNRWGVLVFETTNYNNTTNAFDGTSRGRTTVKQSDGLPTGTYFYIINYKSLDGNNNAQDHKLDGYLYLSK
ncbi:gliding motility-associated C-terminal domain-containing protein [Flavobacterium sp.]|uniref:HYR-like domain-containing protein n=1 Tax=Flavobacterium sp. TaxID=239 RepID=UPI0031DC5977